MTMAIPQRMRAVCTNCRHPYVAGTVTVWLKRDGDRITNEPRDDVSFRCTKGCDEVHPMEVEVLELR